MARATHRSARRTALVAALVGVLAYGLVPVRPATADAGCRVVTAFTFQPSYLRVFALNVMACADPDQGHDNTVTIRRYNPRTGQSLTLRGKGTLFYYCEGTDLHYFYGPGPRLEIPCA